MTLLRIAGAVAALLVLTGTADAKRYRHVSTVEYIYDGKVVGHRPAGCPNRYCGCEAAIYKFGRIIPDLNLASNWIRMFPRTSPAPGMAAARSGHVMILVSHISGNEWLVHDGNSGHHLTREHVRSIAGYVVVDPNGNRVASSRKHQKVALRHHQYAASY